MRSRNRAPKRSMDCPMRLTSAISIPMPTIMVCILQQAITAVDEASINHASFCGEFMRSDGASRVNVQRFVPVGDEPVRDQHSMAAEVHSLGAHVRGAAGFGHANELGHRIFKF